MYERDRLAKESAIISALVVTAIGLFATVLASARMLPYRQFVLLMVNTFNKKVTMSNIENVLLDAKTIWWKALLAIAAIYALYYAAANPEKISDAFRSLLGFRHAVHKIGEQSKYAAKKMQFEAVMHEKKQNLETLRKNAAAESRTHEGKTAIDNEITKILDALIEKKKEFTIKDVMEKVEKKRPLGPTERQFLIDKIKHLVNSNDKYAIKKKLIA
ncbi:MAG: hypothetical protein AABX78_04045 [Nanoarchaeota archaeon]